MEPLGGPAEVELLGDCYEIADLSQVQIRTRADARKVSQRTERVLDFCPAEAQDKASRKRGLVHGFLQGAGR